jgi:hypothetical protein
LYWGYDLDDGPGFVEDGLRERLELPWEMEEPVEDCDGVLVSCTVCQRGSCVINRTGILTRK